MGSPFNIWWTVIWVWIAVTIAWFVSQPIVNAVMDSAAPFCASGMALTVYMGAKYAWYYFPLIFLFGMVFWAIWASHKPTLEERESYAYA